MRVPIISDSVWIKSEGGTPWVVIDIQGARAKIARADTERDEHVSNLKLVLPDSSVQPDLGIADAMLPDMIAFIQAHPKRLHELDLHPKHEAELLEKVKEADRLPAPHQKIENGSVVVIEQGRHQGANGVVLCYDPRSNAYVVRLPKVSSLLFFPAEFLVEAHAQTSKTQKPARSAERVEATNGV